MTLNDILEKYKKKTKEELKRAITDRAEKSVQYAAKKMFREYKDVFNKAIKAYYEYETTKYSRHYTGIGTGTGVNLYHADHSEMEYETSQYGNKVPSNFSMEINGSTINGVYLSWNKKKQVSADYVVELVYRGIRGGGTYKGYKGIPFRGGQTYYISSFKTDVLGHFYGSGNLYQILYNYRQELKQNIIDLSVERFLSDSIKFI